MPKSKTIANHPGVKDYIYSPADEEFGSNHDVLLKDGWHFRALDNDAERNTTQVRMTGIFYSVRDFRDAEPVKHK